MMGCGFLRWGAHGRERKNTFMSCPDPVDKGSMGTFHPELVISVNLTQARLL